MIDGQAKKPSRSPVSKEKLAEARRMRKDGLSYRRISSALNVPRTTIYRALEPRVGERDHVYNAEYYEEHKEQLRAKKVKYHQSHKEEEAEYREEHKEQIRISGAEYYEGHREEIAKYRKKWYEDNPGYNKKYYETNKEQIRIHGVKYRRDHRAERNAREARRHALIMSTIVGSPDEIKKIYITAKKASRLYCYICGKLIPTGEAQVDHIFPNSNGGAHAPFNLIPTHARCNQSKNDSMPDDIDIYDRTVVERARRGNNLVTFYNLLNLIISSTEN